MPSNARKKFFYKDYQFPVCARCTGVIIGEIITIFLLIFRIQLNINTSVFLLSIMGLDCFIQFINLLKSNNIRRLITGISGGVGLTYMYYYLIIYIISLICN